MVHGALRIIYEGDSEQCFVPGHATSTKGLEKHPQKDVEKEENVHKLYGFSYNVPM